MTYTLKHSLSHTTTRSTGSRLNHSHKVNAHKTNFSSELMGRLTAASVPPGSAWKTGFCPGSSRTHHNFSNHPIPSLP